MIYSQYLRLGVHVAESNRTVIRKAHGMLNAAGRKRPMRHARHVWLRELLVHHSNALAEYRHVTGGIRRP